MYFGARPPGAGHLSDSPFLVFPKTVFVHALLYTGVGNGLMYVTSMVAVQHYFLKKRAMATGFAVAGSGVGTLVFGYLTQYLIETMGWRKTLIIEVCIHT